MKKEDIKLGKKYKLRQDLEAGKKYGNLVYKSSMNVKNGIVKICLVDNFGDFEIKENNDWYSPQMLKEEVKELDNEIINIYDILYLIKDDNYIIIIVTGLFISGYKGNLFSQISSDLLAKECEYINVLDNGDILIKGV